jgi:hypothetical protein
MAKALEMEDIYNSYEWLIREKLEQLDWLARNMFKEMDAFRIPMTEAKRFVKGKVSLLIADVIQKGAEEFGKKERQS